MATYSDFADPSAAIADRFEQRPALRILLVEDDTEDARLTKGVFRELAVEVLLPATGLTARPRPLSPERKRKASSD